MIQNIVYAIILAVIVVPSWQIGSITLEKQSVTYMLEEHANSIKKYYKGNKEEIIRNNVKKDLELKGLPTEFTLELLEGGEVKLTYQYYGAATVFGYTYYQTTANLTAVTAD